MSSDNLPGELPWILWILVWIAIIRIIQIESNQSERNQERDDENWHRLRNGDYAFCYL